MALAALSGDEQRIVFVQLCNVLDPGVAVALSSVSNELWVLTHALRQQLRADHEAAAALCLKLGKRCCKELREAKEVFCFDKGLTTANLSSAGSTEPSVPSNERSAVVRPLLLQETHLASRSSLQHRLPSLRHRAAAAS